MKKLNLTLVDYPSHSSEADGILKDGFVPPSKSQSKRYRLYSDQPTFWNSDTSRLNSIYSWIARAASVASNPPASRQITQKNLRRWEKAAREAIIICSHAAGFNKCLF